MAKKRRRDQVKSWLARERRDRQAGLDRKWVRLSVWKERKAFICVTDWVRQKAKWQKKKNRDRELKIAKRCWQEKKKRPEERVLTRLQGGRGEDKGQQAGAVRQETEGVKGHLREGKGYQGTTNHYKVQKVPQVTKIWALVQNQA